LGSSDFHPADVQLAGRVIGGCRLLHVLGVGGMGAVWKAHHLALDIPVALKLLLPIESPEANAGERLLREARAAARLRHPNIVGVFNVGEEEGVHFLVMEFVEGQSLQKLLDQRGALPVAEALKITAQLLDALELTFVHRIVHRDIKPDNILIDQQGVAKLADLGLAKQIGTELQLTQTGMVMGSPFYIAPEQASDTKNAGPLVDIYSLGCVVFHMVAGAPPYGGTTQMEVVLKHIRSPIPDLSQVAPVVPAALVSIVARMMAKDPKDRFQSPAEIRRALQPLLRPTVDEPMTIGGWRKWRIPGLAGLLILGLGATLYKCGRGGPVSATKDNHPVAQDPNQANDGQTAQPETAPAKPRVRRSPRREAREMPPPREALPVYAEPAAIPGARGTGGLSDAVQARDAERLRSLLDRGVSPNAGEGRASPLHQAVHSGDPRFVRMLLEKGANPNARDAVGETPLHEALRRRNYDMVGALLDFGANPNLPDRTGRTPLEVAGGDGFIARKLLDKGAH
jgi:serine/threonine protein kinase